MIIYVFKKHEIFLKTMKIVEVFLIILGKFSELEPEFLTSWSRSMSRTKMDRLCNTGSDSLYISSKERMERKHGQALISKVCSVIFTP
jgi:hypothetical protein